MARRLKPYRQGALDSLYGVHAIINALQVLLPGMTRKEAKKLFRVLIKEIARREALNAIWRGMDGVLFRNLMWRGIEAVAARREASIKVARPFAGELVDLAQLVQTLREKLDSDCVAVVMIKSRIWHWTVITRVTESSLVLFDSDGLSFIRIQNCSLKKAEKRYRINARELLFLRTFPKQ